MIAATSCDSCVFWCIYGNCDSHSGFNLHGASSSIGPAWCGSSATTNPEGHNKRCCWPHHSARAATSVPDAFSGLYQLCHGSSSGEVFFSFRVEPPTDFFIMVSVTVFAFCFQVPLGVYPWQAYVSPGAVLQPILGVCWVAAVSTALIRCSLMLLIELSCSHSIHMVGHIDWLFHSHPIPMPSLHGWDGSSFPGFVQPNNMIFSQSVVGFKPDNSSLVIG